ncbi:hypothetical protein [Rhodoferax saidenbachensis]|uniref:hypothetical protein n=1 Tax=Rhodoferax saidenbachensis TaxID=1484693 RepID=UPI0004AC7FB9|nr:hypothetical protein [Rhodoferax saidenbachensis]
MLVFRFLILLCLLGAAASFAFYVGTGQPRFKNWGWKILKWTLLAAFCFFTVLILERI